MAVVGAGPAGLAAAWELVKAGTEVVLYEARDDPGGRMRSDCLDGFVVDPAVQLLSSTYSAFFRLANEVGAGALLVPTPGRDALWRNGRAHVLTYGSVASMVASTALPAKLKLRLGAKYLPFLVSRAWGLDANDPARTGGLAHDGRSVAEWGREYLGDDFVELMAYPLLAAYYGGTPERISAAVYHALAKVGTDVRVYATTGGMGALSRRILDALRERGAEWRGGDAVSHVVADGRDVTVESSAGRRSFSNAVVAVPARVAAALLAPAPPLRDWLAGVESTPTATLALLLEGRLDVDFFGLSFPRRSRIGESVVAVCMEHRKKAGLTPEGRGLVVVYPAPMIAAKMAESAADDVVSALRSPLEEAFPGITGRVSRARVYRFPEGYTVFYPGYLEHIARFDPDWLVPGVVLAGEYLTAPTVEGAVLSGRRAAERLLTRA